MKQDNVRTNTESVQLMTFFEIAYFATKHTEVTTHDLYFMRSRDVIDHVTIPLLCHFLLWSIGTEPLSLTVFRYLHVNIYGSRR